MIENLIEGSKSNGVCYYPGRLQPYTIYRFGRVLRFCKGRIDAQWWLHARVAEIKARLALEQES